MRYYCIRCGKQATEADIACSACGTRLERDYGPRFTARTTDPDSAPGPVTADPRPSFGIGEVPDSGPKPPSSNVARADAWTSEHPSATKWLLGLALLAVFVVLALVNGGKKPCKDYVAYYDKVNVTSVDGRPGIRSLTPSEEEKMQDLYRACVKSGGDPGSGRDE